MIMEKDMSIGFSGVSGKASSTENDVVGLGLKLQSSESSLSKMMSHHHHHQSSQPMIGGDGGGGPTSNSRANQVVGGRYSYSMSHLYHFDHDVSVGGGGGGGGGARTLHPFHISNLTPFKSPERGVMAAAATLGFPFTEAQWKELQRQAMIYKYMMSSVPVPPHLLLPIPRNFSSAHSPTSLGSGSLVGLRVSSCKDAEPGRCKRTDGKKWRCSRDVAPHQKYCERHMHRGRPRSRKPVEVHAPFNITTTTKKARLHHENPLPSTTPMAISSPLVIGSTLHLNENPLFVDKCPPEILRGLDWIMESEMGTLCESEQQWHQLMMQTNIGLTSEGSIYREEPLNLISYIEFGAPDLVPLEKDHQIGTPIGFIDAWSNDKKIRNESSASSPGNLSPSSLTLSMAMAAGKSFGDDKMGQIQMGLGLADSDHSYGMEGADKDLLSPVSWMGCAPGGPLAEALLPSTVVSNGDSISSPATTVSSPSGVLRRTMLSQSDSSGCDSPTLVAATATTAPPEIVGFKLLS